MKKVLIKSNFLPSKLALKILREGKILQKNETAEEMIKRVVNLIVEIEKKYNNDNSKIESFANELINLLDQKKIIFSTPILTNAGTSKKRPLSACTVPPVNLMEDLSKIKKTINTYHEEGLGTGFNFDNLEDPLAMLHYLNQVALEGAASGKEDRPVGNIALLSVDHPKIKEFIKAKPESNNNWKFNISINITDDFMSAYYNNQDFYLKNGQKCSPKEILQLIANSSFLSGDPGVVFMDRLNKDNPVSSLGNYYSVAPCAEVGLIPGETCQFAYLNLNKFFNKNRLFLKEEFIQAIRVVTRSLDNTLDVNIDNFQIKASSNITRQKRKIGIGVCGVADLLVKLKIPYESRKARKLIKDLIILINYISKDESSNLAAVRGSFLSFFDSLYKLKPNFIKQKYRNVKSEHVKKEDWLKLEKKIDSQGLRNCSTVSLPPTGRSGLIIDASTGIEPFFNLFKFDKLHPELISDLKSLNLNIDEFEKLIFQNNSCQNLNLPKKIKKLYKKSVEISPFDQVKMIKEIQKGVDESISKTINLNSNCKAEDVKNIILLAYAANLKGLTVYVNK